MSPEQRRGAAVAVLRTIRCACCESDERAQEAIALLEG